MWCPLGTSTPPSACTREPGLRPFQGVVTVGASKGKTVEAGQVVATIEAMQMEVTTTAPVTGAAPRVRVTRPQSVDIGALLLVL